MTNWLFLAKLNKHIVIGIRVTFLLILVIMSQAEEKPEAMEASNQDPKPKMETDTPTSQSQTDSQVMRKLDQDDTSTPAKNNEDAEAEFPKTLEGFKYKFNEDGQMRHAETGEPYVFKVQDHHYNQKRYEALGEVINEHVYQLLETEAKLKRVYVPTDASEDEARSFIFMTEDALTNADKLMVLIHGSGVVRAGQWARRLIINDCLDSGTQLPFIHKAKKEGYGVIVLNTNLNNAEVNGTELPVRESDTPEEHASYVWDNFITPAAAKHVAIVAHSYGGWVTTELAMAKEEPFQERVFAVAFTDSVHSLQHQETPTPIIKFFKKDVRNWVSSNKPLDTPIESSRPDCPMVSAGHVKHEMTSWSSFESIFKFLAEKYTSRTQEQEVEEKDEVKDEVKDEEKDEEKEKDEL